MQQSSLPTCGQALSAFTAKVTLKLPVTYMPDLQPSCNRAVSVQALHNLVKQGAIWQPLQANRDLRLIQTITLHSDPPTDAHSFATAASQTVHSTATTNVHFTYKDLTDSDGSAAATSSHSREVTYACSSNPSAASCLEAISKGFTLVLRDMPKRCVMVLLLVEALETQLGIPSGANLYLSPPGASVVPHV